MTNTGVHSQIRSHVVGILVLALIISVGLNLYDRFIIVPQMQATPNNIRVEALNAARGKLWKIKYYLESSKTNFDVNKASYDAFLAGEFVDIYGMGIGYDPEIGMHDPEPLYYWLRSASWDLEHAVEAIFLGNQTGVITSQTLDQYILQKIENLTQTIENIINSLTLSANGVDPVNQLHEKGNLTRIIDYCKQISEVYIDIAKYY